MTSYLAHHGLRNNGHSFPEAPLPCKHLTLKTAVMPPRSKAPPAKKPKGSSSAEPLSVPVGKAYNMTGVWWTLSPDGCIIVTDDTDGEGRLTQLEGYGAPYGVGLMTIGEKVHSSCCACLRVGVARPVRGERACTHFALVKQCVIC